MDVLELLRSGKPEELATLRFYGVIRGIAEKQVIGDYGEFLVKEHLSGRLAPRGEEGYDVLAPAYGRVSVKSRNLSVDNCNWFHIRNARRANFDHLTLIAFNGNYTVNAAWIMTREEMFSFAHSTVTNNRGGETTKIAVRRGGWREQAEPLPLWLTQERTRSLSGLPADPPP